MAGAPRFQPPVNKSRTQRVRRNRRLLWAAAVAVVLLLAAAGGLAYAESRERAREARWRCPGLDRLATDEYALSRPGGRFGGQCLGWTVTRDHAFGSTNPAIQAVISRIVGANRAVRDQAAGPEGKPYVRVGLLMPMTWEPGGAMGEGEILHALQGAAVAQHEANRPRTKIRDGVPLVQLVLANEGVDQTGWKALDPGEVGPDDQRDWPGVVAQLAPLARDRERPLVAVTGMGISVPATREAAAALAGHGIPSIGSVVTANDMTAPSFFKISPSNRQYVDSLAAWVAEARLKGARLERAMLVFDRSADDSYVRTLRESFLEVFDGQYALSDHQRGFTGSKLPVTGATAPQGTPRLFASVVDDICASEPDIVFYSGRSRDLAPFVEALGERGRCQARIKPLLIATGATGLTVTDADADKARVGIIDAASTDHARWRTQAPGTPRAYREFTAAFTGPTPGGLGFPATDLNDGYAVMHRDAVVAAVWAARLWLEDKSGSPGDGGAGGSAQPTAADVRNALFSLGTRPLPGGSGDLHFVEDEKQGLWPRSKPVPIVTIGDLANRLPRGAVYLTN
ncbi:MAG TPA: ABC transporter substrate-binding protein [Pilimelia sp.]|nr:ABC transporter substrate-binding protein [Pilimelia sp.]